MSKNILDEKPFMYGNIDIDINMRVKDGYYNNTMLYPQKPKKICNCCDSDMGPTIPKFCPECGSPFIVDYGSKIEDFKNEMKLYRAEDAKLIQNFKNDLLLSYNYTDSNIKAKLLIDKCWDIYHSGGFSDVVAVFDEFEEVL